jgi:TolB-like protein/class 3 adenylate cyclase/Tfp pilus assembly protein PilF
MTQEGTKRKLTAILSADVKEYSRLMSQDERGTIRTLTDYREAMSKLIQEYKGRVVDSPGDNLLAEFGSVVDAVNCAVEIQRELAERNAELPPARQMEFRIGINLGDVVEEEGRIYGDGVNIAARLESLAEGGGICISGTAYDQVVNKLGLEYEFLGEQKVKNIERPIRVYRVLSYPGAAAHRVIKAKSLMERKWLKGAIAATTVLVLGAVIVAIWHFYLRPSPPPIEPASIQKMAFPLPDKPSIAVLPFTNMSGDPEQEYFSDGITEEIITGLSKVPRLFVIARNSTFTYKGKPVKVQQVSEELGVQYVLEGSVRKAKDRVRITAQLVDATTGKHLWAEKYERELKDIFALQDEIMMKVIAALQVRLTEGEQALIVAGGTDNFEAYAKFLQGLEYGKRFNRDGNLLARKMTQEAIALDPNYPRGYRLLATTHFLDVQLGISTSPRKSLAKAAQLYQKVIAMDPTDAVAHGFLGYVYTLMRQHEKGINEAEKAVTLNPNAADAQCLFGHILHFNGRHKEAIESITKAIRLNPFPPNWYFLQLGYAYRQAGRYEEAIAALKKSLRVSPNNLLAHSCLASCYALSGLQDEARAEVAEVLRIHPKFSLEYAAKTLPYKNPADKELAITALRKAGLPETPPLPLPDKPSIAVLPFVNMSDDPKQGYFSDGITEEIITALSKTPKLFVIARNSTFTYKGKPVKVQQVGRELGVKYVLEGSVRKAGDKVRITAQLVDAKTGHHIWAERYDRELKDIFAIQDEITKKIITSLQVTLTAGEWARVYSRGTNNLQAYLKILKGGEQMGTYTKESNALARQTFEEAITLDPRYAFAYYALGLTHWNDVVYGLTSTPKKSIAKAIELAQKAITLDDSLGDAYGFLANLFKTIDQHDKAIGLAERGVALNPNSSATYFWFGVALNYSAGKHEEAILAFKKAIRLNPMPGLDNLMWLAVACRDAGRYEEAISICEKIHNKMPNYIFAHTCLASCYALMGRLEEAHAEAEKILRINPKFSVDYIVSKVTHYKYEVDRNRLRDSLLKAGLPE